MRWPYWLLERDLLPDGLIRFGIRRLLAARLRAEDPGDEAARQAKLEALVAELSASPVALATDTANEQHYELPTAFFRHILGPYLKYSSCYWPPGTATLAAAEELMLELTAERAGLADGQAVLDLGCGWGSLSLWAAERFPASRLLAVSNSRTQRAHIEAEAGRRGLANVEVVTADMNDFDTDRRFDRVVSVEMFEHMRNYQELLRRIAGWLEDDGRLFVHLFCHRRLAYPFEVRDDNDWMARYFFTGGLMPAANLLPRFDRDLEVEEQWAVNGKHYQRTLLAWLANMDRQRAALLPLLEQTYGAGEQRRWWVYWRVFFLACAELFGYRGGEEWRVEHYRFRRRP